MTEETPAQPLPTPKKAKSLFKKEHLEKFPHARWINSAIRSNHWGKDRKIKITYTKQNGEKVERTVKPITAKGDNLLAHDTHRNALRTFHIGRIDSMEKNAFIRGFTNKYIGFGRKTVPIATGAGIGAATWGTVSGGSVAVGEGVNKLLYGKDYDSEQGKKNIKFRAAAGAIAGGVLGGMMGHNYAKYRAARGAPPAGARGGFTPEHAQHLGFDTMPKTKAEAKNKFRHAARMNHPDLGGDPEKMKKINDAWERFEKSPHFSKLARAFVVGFEKRACGYC